MKEILEILEKYNLLIDEGTMQCAITEESFPALTAELSQLMSKPSVLDKFIEDMTEDDIERVMSPIDLRKELIDYTDSKELTKLQRRNEITWIDEYLQSRPDSRAYYSDASQRSELTDEEIEEYFLIEEPRGYGCSYYKGQVEGAKRYRDRQKGGKP